MARGGAPDPGALECLFRPRSIAVVGASTDPDKIGGRPLKYLKRSFGGPLYPVNRAGGEVQGLPACTSVGGIGQPVDLAIVSVPAGAVPAAIEDCAASGVRAAIVISSGFAETGAEGRAAQERIVALARAAGMRVLGPNCLGLISRGSGVMATFSIVVEQGELPPGHVGIVSQSGAFAAHAYSLAQRRGMGFSTWVTTGNEADVDFADCLAFLADDPETRVIMGYLEGCRDGARLIAAFARARSAGKPVVLIKVGRSEAGAEAAVSHTAALAGSDAVYDAVLRQCGVYRAETIEEFFDVAYACSLGRYPADRRLGIVSISGGVGIYMADRAEKRGLDVPRVPKEAEEKLRALLPYAGVRNPVDITAQVLNDPSLLAENLEIMLGEGRFSALAVFLTTVFTTPELGNRFMRSLERVRERHPDRLIALCTLAPDWARERLAAMGYLPFEEPARAVDACAALADLAEWRRAGAGEPPPPLPDLPRIAAARIGEHAAMAWLGAAGFPVVRARLAATAGEAVAFAGEIGFPVVLKVSSADIAHKSDIGGVLLGVANENSVREGFARLVASARRAAPAAEIDGVLVAEQVAGGVEVIAGAHRDPVFGPVVMLGLGGVFVEVMGDVTFRLAPFGVEEARRMIGELRSRALLEGARGRPPADTDALARALSRLSVIAAAADWIDSLEINPLLVRPRGEGAVAVDALLVPRQG